MHLAEVVGSEIELIRLPLVGDGDWTDEAPPGEDEDLPWTSSEPEGERWPPDGEPAGGRDGSGERNESNE
jgi:hypothetical protein